ncbi:MAG: adenylate/guanylate cyclase domain-containing protein [Deltaproteobacteria bacterium]|nr:adenylate/guanylate cyclase domain-containing protein [Deltaproteobacteria bacterium]
MKNKNKNRVYLTDHLVLIGFGLGLFYWVYEAFFNIFLAKSGLNPFQLLVTPDSNPSWTRLIVLCLFIMFGAHAQFNLNERRESARQSEREAATRERFRRLLSPDLAELVVSGQLEVKKGGENREATVMFADVRNFTKMSENTDASEVLKLLNDYFELIVDVVFRHKGTVDKFIGDEIMVIWGAPIAHDNDPVRAVRASLEIQSELAKFNAHRAAEGLREIQFGISINTGNLVAGYIGSTQAMSYSVIGDIVNVAHGICPAAEPGQIIISESTYEYVHNHFDAVKLEPIQVKGKDEAISVYEILGEKLSAIQT